MVNLTGGLLGVVLLVRHGDRLEFFQDPTTYNPSETSLTPLGTVSSYWYYNTHIYPLTKCVQVQEFQLGSFLRSRYLDSTSPFFITGISEPLANIDQLIFRADAAGEGDVILQSVGGLLQGLYPATTDYNITLANGTTVIGALGGYQYVPGNLIVPERLWLVINLL